MDKLAAAQGVGRPTFGGKKLHNDVIFPDFSAFHRTDAGAPAVPQLQPIETPGPPEPTSHSSPTVGAPATGEAAGPGAAGSVPPATILARKDRAAAPPFSWLGVDAWPALPGVG